MHAEEMSIMSLRELLPMKSVKVCLLREMRASEYTEYTKTMKEI